MGPMKYISTSPDQLPKKLSSKVLGLSHHQVWDLTRLYPITEGSKTANRGWVDYEECSLSQAEQYQNPEQS